MAARTGPLRAWRSSRLRLHRVGHPANVSRFWIRRPSCRFKVDLLTPHAGADLPPADTGLQSFTIAELVRLGIMALTKGAWDAIIDQAGKVAGVQGSRS